MGTSEPLRCSVWEVAPDIWSIHSNAGSERLSSPTTNWRDMPKDWDNSLMWDNMSIEGEENWIV